MGVREIAVHGMQEVASSSFAGSSFLKVRLFPDRCIGYNSSMNPEQLNEQLSREPYVPLRLHLSDGDAVDITNPGLAFINGPALYVFRTDRPNSHLADDHRLIALRHIVQVEQIADHAAL